MIGESEPCAHSRIVDGLAAHERGVIGMDARVEPIRECNLRFDVAPGAQDALVERRKFGRSRHEVLHLCIGHLAASAEHADDLSRCAVA